MYELKKIGKVFTSKFVGTGPSSYETRIYRAAVSRGLRNTAVEYVQTTFIAMVMLISGATQVSRDVPRKKNQVNVPPKNSR